MKAAEYTDVATELRSEVQGIDFGSSTWRAISEILQSKKESFLVRLANPQTSREDDLVLKGRLALIRELQGLPPRLR